MTNKKKSDKASSMDAANRAVWLFPVNASDNVADTGIGVDSFGSRLNLVTGLGGINYLGNTGTVTVLTTQNLAYRVIFIKRRLRRTGAEEYAGFKITQ